jgi:hypothetical protein
MSDASTSDRQRLLVADVVESSATAAGYLRMVGSSADLHDRAGMRYHMRCAVACVKAAVRSFKEFEELEAAPLGEAAE